ncbi:elongation factor 1b [Cavenderia fasciculata]|uniref:Elongation factor 1b n=1 Tax=Cavenderia fasciculata TaxID=261658 RepID=F4PU25_CACFS|nr:elongation factor 1b [Cavenderia fasciculata]EGG21793.1 elongation factor 1b [Cavenderia fasciculata]|eukprot:XP_004359643.1 elongation factor 1b [Cavenderia fasciculata]
MKAKQVTSEIDQFKHLSSLSLSTFYRRRIWNERAEKKKRNILYVYLMPSFADLTTDAGVIDLNEYLKDKTYLVGFLPSNVDQEAVKKLGKAPCATKYPHANRWYNTIQALEASEFVAVTETITVKAAAPAKADDDVDLFGDDEDDEEYERQLEERRAAAAALKKPKEKVIAKSSILLDVKPWDDETDMAALEASVRTIVMPGLVWGASKLVAVGYGIKKLQINCVVEDDKVSVDDLSEQICAFEDYVQSCDVAAFNKI